MFLKALNAAAVSAAFVLALGASSLSVQADTTGDSYDQARCAEAQTTSLPASACAPTRVGPAHSSPST